MTNDTALIVPVYKNFEGFARLMASIDESVLPIIISNYDNNIGVSRGWNEGLRRAAGCNQAIICNDDVILEPGTIRKLIAVIPQYDLVTGINTRDESKEDGFDNKPDFSCFMVKPRSFIDKFGWFDENFSPAYFEDNDMHYRIKLAGGTAVRRKDAGMHHVGSVTQFWGGSRVVSDEMFRENQLYYFNKWGGQPGSELFDIPFGQ